MNRKLIVFTRFPVPGSTKTRLIPAVGAERAAEIQRTMTEQVVATARSLTDTQLEIWFYGGTREQMEAWLGSGLTYVEQPEGDLGNKMESAFASGFSGGASQVALIGTDCPSITSEVLKSAFQHLRNENLVLGPTYDGGYYLIGQSTHTSRLFEGIDWGTDSVLTSTLARAEAASLTYSLLETLHDIDTPSDLKLLDSGNTGDTISVIIPALNEGTQIEATIAASRSGNPHEILVVDGGSNDGTAAIAEKCGASVIAADRGRARQLNAGADAATGKILLFLHADTLLPAHYDGHVRKVLALPNTACGAFRLGIDSNTFSFRILEALVSFRSIVLGMPYGDQALFVTKRLFTQMDGFTDMRLMDDYDFVRRARKHGKVRIAQASVRTSARRWETMGILKTTLINQYVVAAYHFGADSDRLAEIYARQKGLARK